ncbi:MAG: PAS domain S-box protein [Chitinophagaceae bacterium]|nr:MAG: PAS domain S-box protein [Chitinophagaceae bacterium]
MTAYGTQENHARLPNFAGSLSQIFDGSGLAVYVCDADGYIRYFNDAAAQLWGRQPEIGKDQWCGAWKMYDQRGAPVAKTDSPMARCIQSAGPIDKEMVTIERPDNSFSQLLVHPNIFLDAAGKLAGAQGILVDVSQPKETAQHSSVFSAIVESSDDAIISKNLQGTITSWNKAAQNIFGYTAEEIIGRNINTLIPSSLQGEEKKIIAEIRRGKKVDHFQTTRITKYGKHVKISLTASPIKDINGQITGVSKIARDITDHLAKEEALRENAERLHLLNTVGKSIAEKLELQSILQTVVDATTLTTGATTGQFFFTKVNAKGEPVQTVACCGIDTSGKNNTAVPPYDLGKYFYELCPVLIEDSSAEVYLRGESKQPLLPTGLSNTKSYMAMPVLSNEGIITGALVFAHESAGAFDKDDLEMVSSIASYASVALDNSRLFEQVSALNNKKDEFIALASHELKTPITTIKGYLQILQKKETDPAKEQFLAKCLIQVNHLNKLVGDLFDVSRIEASKLQLSFQEVGLPALVSSVIEPYKYSHPSHTILFKSEQEALIVQADKPRLERVLSNIINNAIKYSPDANKVQITVEADAQYARVRVKDFGIGLSKEQQQKIFTRFYRLEGAAPVSGLGLGLYLSKEIMEKHNGKVTVQSEPGKGSEFAIWLPL